MNEVARLDHLDIHPSVVFQLGDTLISDEVQAIVELVKNSYDADATWTRVAVETDTVTTAESSFFPGRRGQVVVEDDGTGMDAGEIERGWLIIAKSPKREAKERGQVTPKFRRTPLGDKGLGRLGVQRLGWVVELVTAKTRVIVCPSENGEPPKTRDEPVGEVYHIGIDWNDFWRFDALSKVPVQTERLSRSAQRRGTRVIVSELRDPSVWSKQAISNLQRKLSQVIFPFGKVRPFRVYATVNGEDLDLLEISDRLRDAAHSRFTFRYAEGILSVEGSYKLTAFRPPTAKDLLAYNELLAGDRGRAFYNWLAQDQAATKSTGAKYADKDPWFLKIRSQQRIDHLGHLQHVGGEIADPGSFEGEIDVFDLGREAVRGLDQDIFRGFNEVVKDHSGVRVFRDGFAIRPYGIEGNDWLELGGAWTGGSSYYGLKPRNVIGYVSITASRNSQLVEKTDREGFTDSPHARNFIRLMREVTDSINRATTTLHRRYNVFRDARDRERIGADEAATPEALFDRIRATARGAAQLTTSVSHMERTLEQTQRAALAITTRNGDERDPEVVGLVRELEAVLLTGRQLVGQVEEHVRRAAALGSNADVLERDLSRVQEQLLQFSELAALGLTAEAVSHEMRTVAANLAARTRTIRDHLRARQIADAQLVAYTEHVRSAVSALRKQLSHLAPGLRYVREQVDTVSVETFIKDLSDFHKPAFENNGIAIVLDQPFDDFTVRINRGKLTQVLDNLFYNSRYWLRQDLEVGRIEKAEIHVRSTRPSLFVWDTGRGVDPLIEEVIFEPFVTNKPKGQGRGLGLFIIRQLLESSGCHVTLLEERNQFNSRYIFEVNLAGALHGGG